MSRTLIAMSGGVDSSVAAYLMKKSGYECIGVTMLLSHSPKSDSSCLSLEESESALRIASALGMEHHMLDLSDDFRKQVIGRFIEAYERGDTPNPCIECNRYIKFGRLLQFARELGCEHIVTGHYARIKYENGRSRLLKGLDAGKDQSYFLSYLTQEQFRHSLFPLGEHQKSEVRRIAKEQGFHNAKKKESQDICFATDGDYAETIEDLTGKVYPWGDFTDKEGRVLGRHKGLIRYTIGQRKGLGLALPEPLYVCEKRVADNAVVLGREEDLFAKAFLVKDLNWIAFDKPPEILKIKVKIRYRQKEQPARVFPVDEETVRVEFLEAQRAVTPGQAAVFYDGDDVVGGGTISTVND
ncbi:MAG: tRNA-specific 2-thiouridylase MnmA [Firmicutes bacterium ADurb.Bin300]|nr:MAG: tRNA-specific 2-thiouridylase MnmA [Firmicutes bacterium ADurb.Bin300]